MKVMTIPASMRINAPTEPYTFFGHADNGHCTFVVHPDGSEKEVFANYGESYEIERVLKGYGFSSKTKQRYLLKIIQHERMLRM